MAAKSINYEILLGEDTELAYAEIDKIKDSGNADSIKPLLEVVVHGKNRAVVESILALLSNLKHPAAIDQFLTLYLSSDYETVRADLLSVVWNSSFVDKSKVHFGSLVQIAINSDYLTSLEALTLIENMDGPFDEADLLEGISLCKTHLVSNPKDDKLVLVKELLAILERFDSQNTDVSLDEF